MHTRAGLRSAGPGAGTGSNHSSASGGTVRPSSASSHHQFTPKRTPTKKLQQTSPATEGKSLPSLTQQKDQKEGGSAGTGKMQKVFEALSIAPDAIDSSKLTWGGVGSSGTKPPHEGRGDSPNQSTGRLSPSRAIARRNRPHSALSYTPPPLSRRTVISQEELDEQTQRRHDARKFSPPPPQQKKEEKKGSSGGKTKSPTKAPGEPQQSESSPSSAQTPQGRKVSSKGALGRLPPGHTKQQQGAGPNTSTPALDATAMFRKGLLALTHQEEPLMLETPGLTQSVDTTMTDLKVVSTRITSLISTVSFDQKGKHGALSVHADDNSSSSPAPSTEEYPSDPNERRVAELKKIIQLLHSDLDIQREAMAKMEHQLVKKDKEIELLRGIIEEMEEESEVTTSWEQTVGGGGGAGVSFGGAVNFDETIGGGGPTSRRTSFRFMRRSNSGSPPFGAFPRRTGSFAVAGGLGMGGAVDGERRSTFLNIVRRPTLQSRRQTTLGDSIRGLSGSMSLGGGSTPSWAAEGEFTAFAEQQFAEAMRLVDRPAVDSAPIGEVTFLCMRIEGNERLCQLHSGAFGKAASQFLAVCDRVIHRNSGHIVVGDIDQYFVAFDDPVLAASCALHIQRELVSQPWPSGSPLDDDQDYVSVKDEQTSQWIWRGLRARIALFSVRKADCQRDIVTGKLEYYGPPVRHTLFLEEQSLGGLAIVDDTLKELYAENLVELEDPVLTFHSWVKYPGSETPKKTWRLYPRSQVARGSDFDAAMRRRHGPPLYRVLVNALQEPCLQTALAKLHPFAHGPEGSGQHEGEHVHLEDDESDEEGGEGSTLRGISSATAFGYSQELEKWFAGRPSHVEEPVKGMPAGDQCLVMAHLVDYKEMVAAVEEAQVLNYIRRFQNLLRQLKPPQGATEIRVFKDRVLFAFSDPIPALEFALLIQDRSVSCPWSDAGDLLKFCRPRRWREKVVHNGPRIATVLHWCRVKALRNIFNPSKTFYIGQELDEYLQLVHASKTEAVAGLCGSIVLSELMYSHAVYNAGVAKLAVVQAAGVVMCEGHPRAIYRVIHKNLIGRVFVDTGYIAARQEAEETTGDVIEFLDCVDAPRVSKGLRFQVWESLLEHNGTAAGDLPRAILPSFASLAQLETINSLSTQAVATRSYFERAKNISGVNRLWTGASQRYRRKTCTRRRELIERLECLVMESHDGELPSSAPPESIVMNKLDVFDLFTAVDEEVAAAVDAAIASLTPHGVPLEAQGAICLPHDDAPGVSPGSASLSLAPAGDVTPEAIDLRSPGRSAATFDAERMYFHKREQKVTAEIVTTHKAIQHYFTMLKQYLSPIIDEGAEAFGDDEFIVAFVQFMRNLKAAEDIGPPVTPTTGGGSVMDARGTEKIGDQWRQLTNEAVTLSDQESISFDVVKLCHSLVAHCCRHFLFTRTIVRRVQRKEKELEEQLKFSALSGVEQRFTEVAQTALRVSREAAQEKLLGSATKIPISSVKSKGKVTAATAKSTGSGKSGKRGVSFKEAS